MLGWIFSNLLAIVGVCVGWLNPFHGVMIFYMFSVLRPTSLWFWAYNPYDAPRYSFYVALSTLAGWFMQGFGDWSGLRRVALPLWGMALYLGAGLFTWRVTAIVPTRAWHFLYPQLTIGLMMLVTVTLVRDARSIKIFGWVLMVTLGYLAYNFNLQYLDNPVYLRLRGFGGVDNNGTAMIMVMAVPLGFFFALYSFYVLKKMWLVGLCVLLMLAEIHVVLFSFSRGGQLGLCVVGVVLFFVALFVLPNKGLTILGGLIAVAVGLHLAGEEVRERFWSIFADAEERDASASSRFATWQAAWNCMKDYPLGVGPRCFNLISTQYGLAPNKSVHNLFLQTGADYGFAGMIGLAVFYTSSAWKCFRMTFHPVAKRLVWPRYFGHMVSLSLAGMLVCSQFIGMESVEVGYLIALLGLCTVAYVDNQGEMILPGAVETIPELADVPRPGEEEDGSETPDPFGSPEPPVHERRPEPGAAPHRPDVDRELVANLVRGPGPGR